MNLTRRHLLAAAAVTASSAALSGCKTLEQMVTPLSITSDKPVLHPMLTVAEADRLLGRAAYGQRPGDRTTVQSIGIESYIEQQLQPEAIEESATLNLRIRALSDQIPNDFNLLYEQDDQSLILSLAQSALLRAVYSNRGLYERTVEFWSDHFNIYSFKTMRLPQYNVLFHLNALRPHAFSSFRQILGATARSAAILCYLDNDQNRAGRPNENYARELMELHTLGIHGGYNQFDVTQLARCLTGWTIDQQFNPGGFKFEHKLHDMGTKTVLHRVIKPGDEREMEDVLDTLASHSATAAHLAKKLLIRFRGDASVEHIDHVSSVFQKTNGDIKSTIRSVFLDCGAIEGPPILKRPFDYTASAFRVLDIDTDCGPSIVSRLNNMGQAAYQWPRPDGYPDRSTAWANCLSPRWQFALDLAAGHLHNTSVNWNSLFPSGSNHEIVDRFFAKENRDGDVHKLEISAANNLSTPEFAALALMSPTFLWR